MKVICLFAAMLLAMSVTACRKGSSEGPAPVVASPPPKPAEPGTAPVASPPVGTPDASKPAKDENPDLTALNAAYKKFWQETQSPPANLDILVKRGYLKTMPVPPKGKKFVVNWERMEVSLAPQ